MYQPAEVREGDFFGSVFVDLMERDLITAVHSPRQTQLDLLYFLTALDRGSTADFVSPEGRFEAVSRPRSRDCSEVRIRLRGLGPRAAEELDATLLVSDQAASSAPWHLAGFLPGISIRDLDLP